VQPTKELKEEHNGIKVMLLVLENISGRLETGKSVDGGHLDMIADFIQIYVDKCHHGKEELMLFPALEQAGVAKESGIIGELLAEHTSGRCHVQQFIKDNNSYKKSGAKASPEMIKNVKGYIDLMTRHIEKEETILYPLADKELPAMMQGELMWRFEQFEEEVIGAGEHEKLNKLLNVLIDKHLK
jgi:hemerythrin-like domain-containing protein